MLVALLLVVLLGMGAMTLDLGAMYVVRTELQRAADAGVMAAAASLIVEPGGDPEAAARQAADEIVRLNPVMNTSAGLAQGDVEFGRAVFNSTTGRYSFESGSQPYDAVRVTVRRSAGSEGGPLMLGFANVFGRSSKDLAASAAAVLLPRDIAVVIDLSGSMNDDSELRHYATYQGDTGEWRPGVQINLRDIWAALDGPPPERPYVPGPEGETQYAGDSGPAVFAMTEWGSAIVPNAYDPASDPGLWYLRKYYPTTDPAVPSQLSGRGYGADEIAALVSGGRDGNNSNHFRNRAAVTLGLADWQSGYPGAAHPGGGNGNDIIGDSELIWRSKPAWYTTSWTNYINYVASSYSAMENTDPQLRYRYGLKTFVNYALEQRPRNNQTPVLWATPEQPLQAVKDAVNSMVGVIAALDSLDNLSLEIFAQSARHEVDLTDQLSAVPDRLFNMQAAHYDNTTNLAGGLAQAINVLTGPDARPSAAKVIVIMSDGKPNTNLEGGFVGFGGTAYDLVRERAREAQDEFIRIYAVSVGEDVDRSLMQEIAAITGGQEFHASGTPEEYTEELEAIFRSLGGKRPVVLIE